MEQWVTEILLGISWSGVTALAIWKLGAPLLNYFLDQQCAPGKGKETFKELQDRVTLLTNNHISHIEEEIKCIKAEKTQIKQELNTVKGRVIRIETILERNLPDKK